MKLGTGFDLTGLTVALQDYMKSGVNEATALFAYSIAESKLHRLMLSDLYSGVALKH